MMSGEVRTAATVIDAQIGVVGQNEIPCLVVSFKTNDPRFQTIAAKIFFTPAAEKQAAKSLTALGWNPEANNWDIDALILTNALIGRDASLVVECIDGRRRLGQQSEPGSAHRTGARHVPRPLHAASN